MVTRNEHPTTVILSVSATTPCTVSTSLGIVGEQALPGVAGLGKRCSVPVGEASYGVGQESEGWARKDCRCAKAVGGLENKL